MFGPAGAPPTLEILVLPETTLILLASVIEPLRAANRLLGRAQYEWRITTPGGDAAMTATRIPIPSEGAFAPEGALPLVVLASYNAEAHATPALVRALARAGRARPAVGAAESGVLALARAGLLDGRRAAAHAEDIEDIAARFPAVRMVPDRWVIDGPRFTASGASPAFELMLELVRRREGLPLALAITRLFGFGSGGPLAPDLARRVAETPAVAAAIRAMEAHAGDPLPVERIARLAGVSARHLRTLFRQVLGVTPQDFDRTLRLNRARQMLAETRRPVLEIAAATGFTSPAAFARAYRRAHGESPTGTRGGGR